MTGRKLRNGALAAWAVLAAAGFALAHTWLDTSKPEAQQAIVEEAPSPAEAMDGYSGVYRVTLEVGQKTIVEIHDNQGCDAEIKVVNTTGDAAKVKAKLKTPLVRNQLVSVEGKAVGVSESTITVRGKDVVQGTGGPCTEDTKNKLVVTVLASGAQSTKEFGGLWRNYAGSLRSDFRTSLATARTEIRSHIAALSSGSADIETAAMSIYRSAHEGLVRNQESISTALGGFQDDGIGLLTSGGFSPQCEPRGFGAGSGGPWDLALRDTYLLGFGGLQGIDKEMLNARTQFDKLTAAGKINAQMTYQPGYFQLPAYAPPSRNPSPGTASVDKLQIQLYGGVTFQNPMGQMEGCLWFGGRYDPAKGAPTATLTDPSGAKIVKTASQGSAAGSWGVQYDNLTPGLTYRVDLGYSSQPEKDSCALSLPWLDPR